ncbi:hypothetical protein ABK040_009429 [Willaertia magna]
MSLASLQFNATLQVLKLWEKGSTLYEKVRDNKLYIAILISSIILIGTILLILFGGSNLNKSKIKFDPYEMLQIGRNATNEEITKSYRTLSRRLHPDRNREDEPEVARQKFIDLKTSRDILLDEKKRKNYDQYGDPNPPFDLLELENYPDLLMDPGAPFVIFYGLLGFIFVVLIPFGVLIINPGLEEPLSWMTNVIFENIQIAEKYLQNEQLDSCFQHLQIAENYWNVCTQAFPLYRKSPISVVIQARLTCRKAQILLLNYEKEQDAKKLNETIQLLRGLKEKWNSKSSVSISQRKKDLKQVIQPFTKDVLNLMDAIHGLKPKDKKEIEELLYI